MSYAILDLSDSRRSLKERRNDDPVAMQNYREVNEEIRRIIKEAKELDHRPIQRN